MVIIRQFSPRMCLMKTAKKLTFCLFLFFMTNQSFATDLWQLYQHAQRNNGLWASQQYDYLAKQKDEIIAKGDLFPQIGLQSSIHRNHFYPDDNIPDIGNATSQIGIGLRQALFRADKWATFEKAKIAMTANQIQLLQQHQQFTEQIIKAYLTVLQVQAMTESLNAENNALTAQYQMMQAKLQQGVVARVDTEEIFAKLQSVQALLANNEVAIMNAKQQLSLLTGQTIEEIHPLKTNLNLDLINTKSIEQWLQHAQEHNLELQLAQTQVALAKKQQDFLKANVYPRVDLVANIGWQHNSSPLQSTSNGTNYGIGIEIDFPFYTGGRTLTALEQGALQTQSAMSQLTFVQQSIMTQTTQAYLNIIAQKATIQAQQTAVQSSAKVAEASKTGYELGVRSMVDTLLAQSQYHASQRELIKAQFDYLKAYVELQKTIGNLNQETVQTVNQQLQ